MVYLTYFFISVFIHFTSGQITSHVAAVLNSINSRNPQFGNARSNARFLTFNTPFTRNLGIVPASNLARNVVRAENGFSNIANGNTATFGTNVNLNPNPANIASNLAKANMQAAGSDLSNVAKPNLAYAANSGEARSFNIGNAAQTSPKNIASSNALSQYRLVNPAQNHNSIESSKVASNLANGNKNKMTNNGRYANTSGNFYSQSALAALPSNQQYGIHIKTDALKIAGNVYVAGKLPFIGTVSLNGRVQTRGAGFVNYASSR